jgi:hypothetical protein
MFGDRARRLRHRRENDSRRPRPIEYQGDHGPLRRRSRCDKKLVPEPSHDIGIEPKGQADQLAFFIVVSNDKPCLTRFTAR